MRVAGRSGETINEAVSTGGRLLAVVLIGSLCLFASACLRRSPAGIAQSYVESLRQFDYTECYKLLSIQDRTDRTLQQFLTEIPLGPDVSPIWFRPILHVMHFELGEARRNPGATTAYVPVRITMPDLPLWERTLNARAGNDASPSQLAHRSLSTGDYPTITYNDRIFLVKEYHHWRIMAGFAARDRLLEQERKAMLGFYDGKLDDAVAQLELAVNEFQQLPGTGNFGLAARLKRKLAELKKIENEKTTATAYDTKLKLDGVVMRMAEERVPAIFGEVTNTGNRPIDDLELSVTWYQGRGKDLKVVRNEHHPIIITPLEFTDFSRQVVPFLPGERQQFGFILTAPPEVQQNATPYVSIGSLAFTQIPAPPPHLQSASNAQLPHPVGKAASKAPVKALSAVPSSSAPLIASGRETNSPVNARH